MRESIRIHRVRPKPWSEVRKRGAGTLICSCTQQRSSPAEQAVFSFLASSLLLRFRFWSAPFLPPLILSFSLSFHTGSISTFVSVRYVQSGERNTSCFFSQLPIFLLCLHSLDSPLPFPFLLIQPLSRVMQRSSISSKIPFGQDHVYTSRDRLTQRDRRNNTTSSPLLSVSVLMERKIWVSLSLSQPLSSSHLTHTHTCRAADKGQHRGTITCSLSFLIRCTKRIRKQRSERNEAREEDGQREQNYDPGSSSMLLP